MRTICVLIACGLAAAWPLRAQVSPAPVAAGSPARVAIPFAPPLGEPLRYRQTVDETRNGRPVSTSLEFTLRFVRDGTGYVMTVAYSLPPGMPRTHPAIAMLMRPVALRLNERGEIFGMVDEDGYWRALDGIVDGLARHVGPNDPAAAATMRRFLASMRAMPEEGRLSLISRNFSPIIEFAGAEMRVGEVEEGTMEGQSAFGPVTQQVRTTLVAIDGEEARIEASYRIGPDQVAAILQAMQSQFARAPAARADTLRELSVERRDTARVSLRTGLAQEHVSIVSAQGERGGQPGGARRTQRLVRVR